MNYPESKPYNFDHLTTRVERHVARHIERGDTVFRVRPVIASLAIAFTFDPERYAEAKEATDEAAIATLEAHGVEAEIFAIRRDLGNGLEDTFDKIRISRRDGEATNAPYGRGNPHPSEVVVRHRTRKPSSENTAS